MALAGVVARWEAALFGLAAVCPGVLRWNMRFSAGYDGRGRVSVTHVVERGYSGMLTQPELE